MLTCEHLEMTQGLLRLVPEMLVRCIDADLKTLGDDVGLVAFRFQDASEVY